MIVSSIKILLKLTRLDTSGIAFLSLAVPLTYSTRDIQGSLLRSLPVLTISMCGFVINDLHDIDKDAQNHPGRPLPSKSISPSSASLLYFLLLTMSLIVIKACAEPQSVYLYLVLLIGLINYNYVVSYVPSLKNPYVAAVGIVPVLILSSLLSNERTYWPTLIALFCYLFGREMLMDIEDARGDGSTLVKKIGLERSQRVAFMIKLAGTMFLSTQVHDFWGVIIFLIILVSDASFFLLWHRQKLRATIIAAMKVHLVIGIYFLL